MFNCFIGIKFLEHQPRFLNATTVVRVFRRPVLAAVFRASIPRNNLARICQLTFPDSILGTSLPKNYMLFPKTASWNVSICPGLPIQQDCWKLRSCTRSRSTRWIWCYTICLFWLPAVQLCCLSGLLSLTLHNTTLPIPACFHISCVRSSLRQIAVLWNQQPSFLALVFTQCR